MQLRELSKPITSKVLNESLAKQFGYRLNLEQFTDPQLEDVRNKLRTEVSQFEVSESFDTMNTNPKYQKTRALLDVINQEIMERTESKDDVCPDCHEDPCECDEEETMKTSHKDKKKEKAVEENYVNKTFRQRAQAHSVPAAWINNALSRVELGESDREELKAELKLRYDLNESQASYVLLEGEEEKAKVIMATKDMVDQITGWLEDTAQLKAEQLLELMDSIRETMGSDVASKYEQAVKPALEGIYSALESSRQGLSAGLALVSGGEAPTMGAPTPDMGAEAGAPTPDMGGAPEEAGAAPAAGPEERMQRESVDYSRKLGMILASKKK